MRTHIQGALRTPVDTNSCSNHLWTDGNSRDSFNAEDLMKMLPNLDLMGHIVIEGFPPCSGDFPHAVGELGEGDWGCGVQLAGLLGSHLTGNVNAHVVCDAAVHILAHLHCAALLNII